ncbi:hypothetical protein GCM10009102_03080 [Sphingomonas insulae]|uniref:Transposase n=1 Tax=Sphingomonas insulae TaxID=424800 RepID=A0ABN1HLN6_9SPHN
MLAVTKGTSGTIPMDRCHPKLDDSYNMARRWYQRFMRNGRLLYLYGVSLRPDTRQ